MLELNGSELTVRAVLESPLRESTLLSVVLDSVADGVIVADTEGVFISWNSAAEQLVGLGQKNMPPERWGDYYGLYLPDGVTPLPPDEIPLYRAIRGIETLERQLVIRNKNKKEGRLFSSSGKPIFDGFGNVLGGVVVFHDITELKKKEADLELALESAEVANRSKSFFLANVSHELRTPLTSILGYSEILLGGCDETRSKEYLIRIRKNGEELLRLVNELLDLTKVEVDGFKIEKVKFSTKEFLGDLFSSLDPLARTNHTQVAFESVGSVPGWLFTDPYRLNQVLKNIIGNAIKFSSHRSVRVQMKYDDRGGKDLIEFLVEDEGIGISKKAQKQMFKPFIQEDNSISRRFGGTGLGLTIAKKLAKLLGGDVSLVRSTVGQGSEFSVSVLAGSEPDTPSISQLTWEEGQVIENRLPNPKFQNQKLASRRILVVEDSRDIRMLLEHVLTESGAHVELARHGGECLSLVMEKLYDVILMDIQMPVLDGVKATEKLRHLGISCPVIALTAHSTEFLLDHGFTDYVTKPVNFERLVDKLRQL